MMYQLFGSADSTDTDVMFFVDTMPGTILERAELCKTYSASLAARLHTDKAVNGNLGIVRNRHLIAVHKGTVDELNNSLFCTYVLHEQSFENQVQQLLPRDVDLKFIRCTRMLLSALTRTVFRVTVKAALQNDLHHRLEALRALDLKLISEPTKGYSLEDLKKVLAFQLGQTLALHTGQEVFTKSDICERYPPLEPYLYRQPDSDAADLQALLSTFTDALALRIPAMKQTEEYDYTLIMPGENGQT
ncbi:MAG: hypothetical protein EOP49_30090 [Sphingobacteriales bacterium]|nr:MAG: hypothetical protein EOP49_30090 [Sphingobacteriales bacterium]